MPQGDDKECVELVLDGILTTIKQEQLRMSMQSNRLQGDVAFVTGAASGIGKQVAITLALNGAAVACADINEPGIDTTLKAISELGGEGFGVSVNVGDSAGYGRGLPEEGKDLRFDQLCCCN